MARVVKWTPFQDFDVFERRMRRVLEDMGVEAAPIPAADLYETENELIVELDVPGFDEKELALEVSDHMLTIMGERKEETDEKEKTFFLRERLERQFKRSFTLPPEADLEHVEAHFKTGVLEVHVPKTEQAKPRKVAIKA